MEKITLSSSKTKVTMKKEWFKDWFNSPYYHILYKDRDEKEAKNFIDILLERLQPAPKSSVLDLACGKGRFSVYLAEKGLDVTGLDLSVESITFARQFENDHLSFFTHDMRTPFRTNYFDYIFNFFTSFGYFESEKDHVNTLINVAKGLKEGGIFVLDFFNSQYVMNQSLGEEFKVVEGVPFQINKQINNGFVTKTIDFQDQGKNYFFEERVHLFKLEDFKRLFTKAGLQIVEIFGDYQLQSFDLERSPRLILVAKQL